VVFNWGLWSLGFEINYLFDFGFLGLLDFIDVIKLCVGRIF
jgi:hypothetical protein